MATYEKRPERDTVEAFRVGDEPPEWFAKDKEGRWRRIPLSTRSCERVRYIIRKWLPAAQERAWLDAADGSYVVYNGPEEEFTLMSAERFEWLYRELFPKMPRKNWPENTSAEATKIDAPASKTAHSGGPTGEHTACSYD